MNLLAAYVATRIAAGEDALPLERLIRRIEDDCWRDLIAELVNAPAHERPAILAKQAQAMPEKHQAMESLRWADGDASVEQIAREFPEVRGTDLETARERIATIDWLWPGWVPYGSLTILGGDSSIGKSFVALRMAQAALGEEDWPDGAPPSDVGDGRSRRVCWIDTEGRYPVLLDRTTRWKLDRGRIGWPLDPENENNVTARWMLDYAPHWQALRSYLDDWRPQLVIVDSLSGGHTVDESRDAVRPIIKALANLAEDLRLALVATHSIRKRKQGDDNPVIASFHELSGARAHSQFPMSIILFDKVTRTAPKNRLRVDKANLAQAPPPLAVRIMDEGLECEPHLDDGQGPLFEKPAEVYLAEILSDGPKPISEIRAAFKARGLPCASLRRLRDKLGIEWQWAGRPGFRAGPASYWRLPGRDPSES